MGSASTDGPRWPRTIQGGSCGISRLRRRWSTRLSTGADGEAVQLASWVGMRCRQPRQKFGGVSQPRLASHSRVAGGELLLVSADLGRRRGSRPERAPRPRSPQEPAARAGRYSGLHGWPDSRLESSSPRTQEVVTHEVVTSSRQDSSITSGAGRTRDVP
jgi:hypothetical protein